MLKFERIHTTDGEAYRFVEDLWVDSFVPAERRNIAQQRHHTDHHPRFHLFQLKDAEAPVGMISLWHFGTFRYIEHFAIAPQLRSHGWGARTLQTLQAESATPIVLEVELPTDEMTRKRIAFYERNHFRLDHHPYFQPPYAGQEEGLPLQLMVWGELDLEQHFPTVRQTLYEHVYDRPTQPSNTM